MRPSERLLVARELSETRLGFLMHPTVPDQGIADTGDAVEKVLVCRGRMLNIDVELSSISCLLASRSVAIPVTGGA